MPDFIASNGYTVTELEDGQIGLSKTVSGTPLEYKLWLRPDEAQALREAFADQEYDLNAT